MGKLGSSMQLTTALKQGTHSVSTHLALPNGLRRSCSSRRARSCSSARAIGSDRKPVAEPRGSHFPPPHHCSHSDDNACTKQGLRTVPCTQNSVLRGPLSSLSLHTATSTGTGTCLGDTEVTVHTQAVRVGFQALHNHHPAGLMAFSQVKPPLEQDQL